METYLTIEELAAHLKLAVQTIRRYVLNREIPFCKIKKVIRFRLSDIKKWIEGGAMVPAVTGTEEQSGDLLNEVEAGESRGQT